MSTQQPSEEAKKGKATCIGCLTFLGLAIFMSVIIGTCSSTQVDPEHDMKIEAWTMAQTFVERNLKSPGTADYGAALSDEYQDPDEQVQKTGENTYHATGWVDAQNSFGGTVRSYWSCDLLYLGDGKWRCTSILVE